MSKDQLWQAVLGELELQLSKANFVTWFSRSFPMDYQEAAGELSIGLPSVFFRDWVERKYNHLILQIIQKLTQNQVKKIIYQVSLTPVQTPLRSSAPRTEQFTKTNNHALNPRYTFESFIVGKNNELAHAACLKVVENPGIQYNPLFIYGGVGLGKTHLLQAVGHSILGHHPDKKVSFITAEKFTSDYVEAIRTGDRTKLKTTYGGTNVLLVDDVQSLAGKERTQDEFFHIFNDLYQNNNQILMSSDRLPEAIPALQERLVSRFRSGMITDITQPDLETRIAILETKCREKNFQLSSDVIHYIATMVQTNIRELEGALTRVFAHYQVYSILPDLPKIKEILAQTVRAPRQGVVTTRQIIETVANFYELTSEDLMSKCREQKLAFPRQIAMYLMRTEIHTSFPTIGQELGGRDHTTAIHAVEKITRTLEQNNRLKQEIEVLKQRLSTTA